MVELETKSTPRIAYVFPGQGSQAVGMGHSLYQDSRVAREIFEEADSVLGMPLSRLCFEGPEEELRQTVNAQPAILTVSIAATRTTASVASPRISSYRSAQGQRSVNSSREWKCRVSQYRP